MVGGQDSSISSKVLGLPELDQCLTGDYVGACGKLGIYKRRASVSVSQSTPKASLDDILAHLEDTTYESNNFRRMPHTFLLYETNAQVQDLFDFMEETFTSINCALAVGRVGDGRLIVYIFKFDTNFVPSSIDYHTADEQAVKPKVYRFKSANQVLHAQALERFSAASVSMTTNISLSSHAADAGDGCSFEQLLSLCANFTDAQLAMVRGRCNSVHWKKRSDFQQMFLRCFSDTKVCREMQHRGTGALFYAMKLPMLIAPPTMLCNLHQRGTRLKEAELV